MADHEHGCHMTAGPSFPRASVAASLNIPSILVDEIIQNRLSGLLSFPLLFSLVTIINFHEARISSCLPSTF